MDDVNRPNHEKDQLAELVRLAGNESPSKDRMDRVRAATRRQWREQTRQRSRARLVWSLAAAAAVLGGLAFLFGVLPREPGQATIDVATVDSLSGEVTLVSASGSTVLEVGAAVRLDGVVSTAAGAVALRLPSGHSLRLDRSSEVELRSDRSISLRHGALYVESDPDGPHRVLAVQTPLGRVTEIGTQYELRLQGGGLYVRLREGAVRLEQSGKEHTVDAGTELFLDASGRSERRWIATFGPQWAWVSEIAPLPDLEGRSTYAYLRWVAREKGWSLAFADESVLRAAQTTIVQGRLGQLSPEQSLDAVLPASRLTYRLTEGTLLVAAQR